jgi:hypothetical protein
MIIPTPDFDPLFADDGEPFRTKMLRYIEREFADLLGDRRGLLHSEAGLNALAQTFQDQAERRSRPHAA